MHAYLLPILRYAYAFICAYDAGRDAFAVDDTNYGAAAYVADKDDMPELGKRVETYLNTMTITTGNVAQCFMWADKFKAKTCLVKCWAHIKSLTQAHTYCNRYPSYLAINGRKPSYLFGRFAPGWKQLLSEVDIIDMHGAVQ